MTSGETNPTTADSVILFGPSCIRGVVDQDLTTDLCYDVAQAIGATFRCEPRSSNASGSIGGRKATGLVDPGKSQPRSTGGS